jgi:hypothetical protein
VGRKACRPEKLASLAFAPQAWDASVMLLSVRPVSRPDLMLAFQGQYYILADPMREPPVSPGSKQPLSVLAPQWMTSMWKTEKQRLRRPPGGR